jgi:polyferredoxin
VLNIINRLFRFNFFPLALQIVALGGFILLIAGGLAANTEDMAFAKVLRNTNVANLIVWSYWWPLIILSAIFLGRVWCAVCPMELMTSLAAKVGLKRKPPAFLRSGWVMTAFTSSSFLSAFIHWPSTAFPFAWRFTCWRYLPWPS